MLKVWGEVSNLKKIIIDELEKLYQYKLPANLIISEELISVLADLTQKIRKEIAIYIDRKGNILHVAVGSKQWVQIPEMWLKRAGNGLSGLRCIHTHPNGDSRLSGADLSALSSLRLDLMVALGVGENVLSYSLAYLEPVLGQLTDKFILKNNDDIFELMNIPLVELMQSIEGALDFSGHIISGGQEKALLVLIELKEDTYATEENIIELCGLAETAGLYVVESIIQKREKPDNNYYIGKGKLEEIRMILQQKKLDCVVFNNPLSPAQQNNLAEYLNLKVIDRTGLILDIFAGRARSREGKLQVELAQLNYLLPRLTGQGNILSRLGGGVGTRGPGETKLETDRRHIRKRIDYLERQIVDVKKNRAIQAEGRMKSSLPQITLVGYTNAGKSSLLNALANDSIFAEDRLFATLDPTTRNVSLGEGFEILLTDTVGFIKDLPHQLVDAFKATLEEATTADLLLHIIDISNPNWENQKISVQKVLNQLEISAKPVILVFNKTDLRTDQDLQVFTEGQEHCYISSKTGSGLGELKNMIKEHFFGQNKNIKFLIPFEKGNLLDWLYRSSWVLEADTDYQGYLVMANINENNLLAELKKHIIME